MDSHSHPDFDIIVNNEIGFAGADEYGFVSRNNVARGLPDGAPVDRLDLNWLASTITENPLPSANLPLIPPDLSLLGGGLLTVYGECTLCLAPAAFFRIDFDDSGNGTATPDALALKYQILLFDPAVEPNDRRHLPAANAPDVV